MAAFHTVQCVVCFRVGSAPVQFTESTRFAANIGAVASPPGWGFVRCFNGWSFIPVCSATCAAVYDPRAEGRSPLVAPRQSPPSVPVRGPSGALATHPDPSPRFTPRRWTNGRLGREPDGAGTIRPVDGAPGRWEFSGRFQSSGRIFRVDAPDIAGLVTTLRGAGWLPQTDGGSNEMAGE